MSVDAHKSSFDAVIDARTRVVILGSLPGEVSLQRGEYYANPTNQFWTLIGDVIGVPIDCNRPFAERAEMLLSAGVGLWDVVRTARRRGSLDSDIRDSTTNALAPFVERWPLVKALAFNGGKAHAIGRRALADASRPDLVPLPSSSAAYCAMSLAVKQSEWKAKLGPYLA